MPVPPGLLIDIALLIIREYWRSRRRRAAPAAARAPAPSHASVRRLSPAGRVLRLAVIAGALWLIWREVTRRRAALIEAQRNAVSRAAPVPAASPAPPLPPAPATPAEPSPASENAALPAPPVEAAAPPASTTDTRHVTPPESAASAEPSPASEDAALPALPVEAVEQAVAGDSLAAEPAAPDDAPDGEEARNGALIGWCARCRARHPMQQVTFETNAGGRSIARGVCPVCGAGIARFVARERLEGREQ